MRVNLMLSVRGTVTAVPVRLEWTRVNRIIATVSASSQRGEQAKSDR